MRSNVEKGASIGRVKIGLLPFGALIPLIDGLGRPSCVLVGTGILWTEGSGKIGLQ